MDLRKFCAYVALAVWIAFTAVTVNSANEWVFSKSKKTELEEKTDWLAKQFNAIKGNDADAQQMMNRAQKDLASTQTALMDEIGRESVRKKVLETELWWWSMLSVFTAAMWANKKRI